MKYPTKEYNLGVLYPHLVKEFHPTKNGNLKPNEIYYRSTRKIWWKCPNGKDHEWKGEVRFRFKVDKNKKIHITKCPFCIGKKVSITNCLADSIAPAVFSPITVANL